MADIRRTILIAFITALFTLSFGSILAQNAPVWLNNPTVEHQDGSQPLATDQPRFSWNYSCDSTVFNARQTSYRIIVASTRENAEQGIGDLWDTKTVPSDQMLYILYEGKPLHSRNKAYWRVYTTLTYGDDNQHITVQSKVNKFEISLLKQEDWSAL